MEQLDSTLVDAVFAGHTHNMLHQFTNSGIPIIISECYAKYLNVLYIDLDLLTKKVIKKLIEGPIPICSKVFSKRKICDVDMMDNSVSSNGELRSYEFHGHLVEEDEEVNRIVKPYQEIIDKLFPNEVLSEVKQPMVRYYDRESSINDFVGDAFRNQCCTDISVFSPGMIRIDWPVGPVDYQRLFETIPFNDQILIVNLTGSVLKQIIHDI